MRSLRWYRAEADRGLDTKVAIRELRPYLNFNSDYWKKTEINQGAKCELKMSRTEICRENGKLGGRPKGSLNKVSCEIRALAQLSAPDAFAELARLAREAQSEQTRVAAIKEILDRAYGRPTQPIDSDGQGGAVIVNVVTGVRG